MRVSSRTPEGEPLQCQICGQRSFVLLSDPPRDSVCPNCGCLAWIALNLVEEISDITIDTATLSTVVNDIGRSDNAASVATILDRGLREILRPDAVVIWGLNGYHANEVRLIPMVHHGEFGNETFAHELLRMRRSMAKRQDCVKPFRFTFGLPWLGTTKSHAIGAIELSYVRVVSEDSENIIARVAESLAVVAANKVCRMK